jgi:hypothetical protein
MCFGKTRYVFSRRINKLLNLINEELKDYSCKILWRNSLAPAKLPHGTNGSNAVPGTSIAVDIRGKALPAMVVRPPFIKRLKS